MVTRAFVGDMMARGNGRLINVSSVAGRTTFSMMGAYHASRYAVEALSDALRCERQPFGVRVALIEPGPIDADFIDRMHAAANPYRHQGSVYASMFDAADAIERRTMATAGGPTPVTRAIVRAVGARRPRARYLAPLSGRLAIGVLSLLPTFVKDALLRAVFGLSTRRLRTAARPVRQAAG